MGKGLMRSFPGRFQPVRISGNKRSGENRIYGIEAKSSAVPKFLDKSIIDL